MAQVNVIGRITADLELKTSEKSNPYVRFDIAENIGSRQALHTQYFQVCASIRCLLYDGIKSETRRDV